MLNNIELQLFWDGGSIVYACFQFLNIVSGLWLLDWIYFSLSHYYVQIFFKKYPGNYCQYHLVNNELIMQYHLGK